MRRFASIVFLAGLLSALGGCAYQRDLPRTYKGSDTGYLVVAIAAAKTGPYYSFYALHYRRPDKSAGAQATYRREVPFGFGATTTPDFDTPDAAGMVLVKQIEPGEYELFNFSLFENGYPAQITFSAKNDFSVKFTVEPGKTTYLGRYVLHPTTGKSLIGLTVPAGGVFEIFDETENDLAIARTKNPDIGPVSKQVPPASAFGTPLFHDAAPGASQTMAGAVP